MATFEDEVRDGVARVHCICSKLASATGDDRRAWLAMFNAARTNIDRLSTAFDARGEPYARANVNLRALMAITASEIGLEHLIARARHAPAYADAIATWRALNVDTWAKLTTP